MRSCWRRLAFAWLGLALCPVGLAAEVPDFSGLWLPDTRDTFPALADLPLTPAARQRLAAFDPDRQDPSGFCMPLGTPRNTLAANSPLEVLQTVDRVYFVFQPNLLNVETRRVYLDGRAVPSADEVPPTWLGTSRGRWQGAVLEVHTTQLEPQSLITGAGLSHEGGLRVTERWSVRSGGPAGRQLVNDLTLEDPATFTKPVRLQRVWHWAPHAQFAETNCSERLWIDTLWRYRLAEHAKARAGAKP